VFDFTTAQVRLTFFITPKAAHDKTYTGNTEKKQYTRTQSHSGIYKHVVND